MYYVLHKIQTNQEEKLKKMCAEFKTTADGIFFDDYLRERLETYRTGNSDQPMTFREVAAKTGVSFSKWNHLETGKETFVSWGLWELIYKALVTGAYGDGPVIDPNDVDLMPPTILRERLREKLQETTKIIDTNINNGINNGVIGDNNKQVKAEENKNLDEFKNEVVSNIAGSDMCSDCRKKAVKLVMEAYNFTTF